MKQQVSAFGNQTVPVVLDRGDHGFHRLLAELFCAMLRTLVQQLARIGRLSPRGGAGVDGDGEIVNGETRHQLNSGASSEDGSTHLALVGLGVVKDRVALAARRAPCDPWLHVW